MAKQTLVQAIHLAFSGRSRDMMSAINSLAGKPFGSWPETAEAERQVRNELPFRNQRSYTVHQFIEAAYFLDKADRYRTREHADAMREAARIEAESAPKSKRTPRQTEILRRYRAAQAHSERIRKSDNCTLQQLQIAETEEREAYNAVLSSVRLRYSQGETVAQAVARTFPELND